MTYRAAPASPVASHGPVANVANLFPRRHPSLDTLLIFAVASILGGGPVAGVPGVILGRSLLREIREAPHLYTGTRAAIAGLIVSWIGTLLGGFALASLAARHSVAAATVMLIGGILGGLAAVFAILRQGAIPRLAPVRRLDLALACCGMILLATSSFAGQEWKRAAERAAREACAHLLEKADEAVAADDFELARTRHRDAGETCPRDLRQDVANLGVEIDRKERAHDKRVEDERQERLAQKFESARPTISALVTDAQQMAVRRQWEAASSKLDEADRHLARFEKARISASAAFLTLRADISRERQRLKPELDRIAREKEAAEKAREARERAAREAEERRREAEERRREASERARQASARVRCCDGTLSPSCLCSRASKRGCCSRHGGICGCE